MVDKSQRLTFVLTCLQILSDVSKDKVSFYRPSPDRKNSLPSTSIIIGIREAADMDCLTESALGGGEGKRAPGPFWRRGKIPSSQ
jgi:hypothetical protein